MAKSRGSAVAFALSQSNILRCLADHVSNCTYHHISRSDFDTQRLICPLALSSQVYNKSDQKNLSLVSRTFRDAIASKLFSAIHFTRSGLQNGQYRPLSPHTRLCHCRTLRFVDDISGKEDSGLHKLSKFPPLSSTSAQKFLLTSVKHIMFQMPQLESFEYVTHGGQYRCRTKLTRIFFFSTDGLRRCLAQSIQANYYTRCSSPASSCPPDTTSLSEPFRSTSPAGPQGPGWAYRSVTNSASSGR